MSIPTAEVKSNAKQPPPGRLRVSRATSLPTLDAGIGLPVWVVCPVATTFQGAVAVEASTDEAAIIKFIESPYGVPFRILPDSEGASRFGHEVFDGVWQLGDGATVPARPDGLRRPAFTETGFWYDPEAVAVVSGNVRPSMTYVAPGLPPEGVLPREFAGYQADVCVVCGEPCYSKGDDWPSSCSQECSGHAKEAYRW